MNLKEFTKLFKEISVNYLLTDSMSMLEEMSVELENQAMKLEETVDINSFQDQTSYNFKNGFFSVYNTDYLICLTLEIEDEFSLKIETYK